MSDRNTRSRRAIGKALKDLERGLSDQDVKKIQRANRSKGRRTRKPVSTNIEDWMGKKNDHVVIKGELPYLTFNQMCWFSRRDRKYHFHHRLNSMTIKGMPPEVQREFKGLLIERLLRKNVFHQKFKFIEGTLRAYEKKYS